MTERDNPDRADTPVEVPASQAVLPRRIVCLTEGTTETLYLLGEQERIVGISGFTVRPPEARRDKPRVSAFTSAKIDKILGLEPDLVLGFSDLQADIAAALIRHGMQVHVFNQRSVEGIFSMIATVGAMVGSASRAERLICRFRQRMQIIREAAESLPRHPRVYFEEWDEPLICGFGWVSELIEIAGGVDCFADLARAPSAKDRIIGEADEVVRRAPDIIVGSWCGKRFRPQKVMNRPGWDLIPAVRGRHVYEIKSSDLLQPGPAALGDGLRQLQKIVLNWANSRS